MGSVASGWTTCGMCKEEEGEKKRKIEERMG